MRTSVLCCAHANMLWGKADAWKKERCFNVVRTHSYFIFPNTLMDSDNSEAPWNTDVQFKCLQITNTLYMYKNHKTLKTGIKIKKIRKIGFTT